ncbi:MAG: type IV pilus biogenesis/stability protein PilW [Pseudomonadota bacterium]
MKAARLRYCVAGLALALLAGCAGSGRSGGELKTMSDQTAGEKRAEIRMRLAIEYYEQGQYPVALDEIKQAIAAAPDNAEAYGVRALIYIGMGETALAEENYQRAIKLAPSNPDLSNNYGFFLCQNGRGPQAMPYFDAALKNRTYLSPVKALINAGNCSLKLKDYPGAERYLIEALRIAPDMPTISLGLARVYAERHDFARAGVYINRVLESAKLDKLGADAVWLAIKVQRKLGDKASEATLTTLLRRHHPGSAEYAALQRGAFDE